MAIQIIKDDNTQNDEIRKVIINAFKDTSEAILVENIKKESDYYISYIAKDGDRIVGHVMISPMLLNGERNILSLAPVSVLEEYSNHGIGTRLIKSALSEACSNKDYKIITVLGSDHYYSRFGFIGYVVTRFKLPFEIENRFFQVMEIEGLILLILKTYQQYAIII